MATPLYSHQVKAARALQNGSVLVGGVGSGKSMTSLAYFLVSVCKAGTLDEEGWKAGHAAYPRDLYIITTARKRDTLDWELEAARFGLGGEKGLDGIRVVVDSWNNIKKYTEVADSFFIFDEQRLVGSGVWVKSFYEIADKNQWILLSATPGDTWSDYIPLFVANGFYKNKTEFERRHVVYRRFAKYPQIDRYLEQGRLEKLRSRILVPMPDQRHTVRHHETITVPYPAGDLGRITRTRFNPFTERPIKNAGELCKVARRVVLSDVGRVSAAIELLAKHRRVIIFYNYNYELEILRKALTDGDIPYSEWNGQHHQEILPDPRMAYLVQYTAGAEGWNCTTVDTVIFFSLNYSWKVMEQAQGRIDRMNTPFTDLYYYRLVSRSWIDKGVMKALSQKERFQEAAFGRKMGF